MVKPVYQGSKVGDSGITYVLLLGSNQGDRKHYLESAVNSISGFSKVLKCSSIYETEPWGYESDARYLNQGLMVVSDHTPLDLLDLLLVIERVHARTRSGVGYADRTLDIDIADMDGGSLSHERLIIPHPRIHLRAFALKCMCDLCPEWGHVGTGKTYQQLWEERTDDEQGTVKIYSD